MTRTAGHALVGVAIGTAGSVDAAVVAAGVGVTPLCGCVHETATNNRRRSARAVSTLR